MTRPITAGLDGSAESTDAAGWAAREAERRGLPLRLVHAWITEPISLPPMPAEEAARAVLDQTAADIAERHPGVPVSTELIPDAATNGLIGAAADAEMLVLGSRGRSVVVGFLLGSVGLPVVAHSSRPVVMVRAGAQESPAERGEVVVAVKDAGASAGALLGFAFAAAAVRGATVRAVRAWGMSSLFGSDVPGGLGQNTTTTDDLEAAERGVLTDAVAPWRERYPDVPVIEQPQFGNAAETVLGASSRADLVIVGRRPHRPPLGMRVGPVVHAVLHHAEVPVAVVPYDHTAREEPPAEPPRGG
jgi:nucleotide-binding universal stress UspA family protein